MALAAFFLEGLTTVCLIGTLGLLGVFAFLYVVEQQMKSKNNNKQQS